MTLFAPLNSLFSGANYEISNHKQKNITEEFSILYNTIESNSKNCMEKYSLKHTMSIQAQHCNILIAKILVSG